MNDELPMTNDRKEADAQSSMRHSSFSFLNSIRWRLQIWYGVILAVLLAGFGATAFQLMRGGTYRRVDDELQHRVGELSQLLRQPPRNRGPEGRPGGRPFDGPPGDQPQDGLPDERVRLSNEPGQLRDFNGGPQGLREFHLPPRQAQLFDETDTNGFYFIIWRRDGSELARSTNAPTLDRNVHPVPMTNARVAANPINNVTGPPGFRHGPPTPQPPEMNGSFREIQMTLPPGERILVGRSIARQLAELRSTALMLAATGAGILLLGLVGGWWLASRAIRPIEDISATAAKISGGDLAQRINVSETESELGRLASVLNSTFARLDAAFAQQRQFASDAAHELRTPVSVMLTQTQTALHRERSAAEYRETVESCQRAAQRMRRLIESLLELAKLDAGQQPMKRAQFDLAQTARDCLVLIEPLAAARHVKITCELPPLSCVGDSERLAQVITNLLTNAITYNRENGEVRVEGETKDGTVILRVSDTGVGISAEDLPRVFDRFYRVDSSRTSGNTGLGLAISKAIVEAHGGQIEAASQPARGTIFTVRLPLS
jgi:two-component system, OmpR family, sensor kinase